eukprot:1172358-Prorocentrum_minimum.AAC.1
MVDGKGVKVDGKGVKVDGKGVKVDGMGVKVDGKGVKVDGKGVKNSPESESRVLCPSRSCPRSRLSSFAIYHLLFAI